jgi:5-methylcytosine-specific restriction endonuclease McrA
MPGRILRACSRCIQGYPPGELVRGVCPNCRAKQGPQERSPTTRYRPSSSTERERIRQQVLARDPTCQLRLPGCTGASEVVDHVIPVSVWVERHGTDAGVHDLSNLCGACESCNGSKGGRLSKGTWPERPPRPKPGPTRLR